MYGYIWLLNIIHVCSMRTFDSSIGQYFYRIQQSTTQLASLDSGTPFNEKRKELPSLQSNRTILAQEVKARIIVEFCLRDQQQLAKVISIFNMFFWWPLISLFRTTGDICYGFQSQGEFLIAYFLTCMQ